MFQPLESPTSSAKSKASSPIATAELGPKTSPSLDQHPLLKSITSHDQGAAGGSKHDTSFDSDEFAAIFEDPKESATTKGAKRVGPVKDVKVRKDSLDQKEPAGKKLPRQTLLEDLFGGGPSDDRSGLSGTVAKSDPVRPSKCEGLKVSASEATRRRSASPSLAKVSQGPGFISELEAKRIRMLRALKSGSRAKDAGESGGEEEKESRRRRERRIAKEERRRRRIKEKRKRKGKKEVCKKNFFRPLIDRIKIIFATNTLRSKSLNDVDSC